MKRLMVAGFLLVFFTCNTNKKQIIILPPDINVLNFDTALRRNENGYFYHGKPFSGYMIQHEKDRHVVYKLPIINYPEVDYLLGKKKYEDYRLVIIY